MNYLLVLFFSFLYVQMDIVAYKLRPTEATVVNLLHRQVNLLTRIPLFSIANTSDPFPLPRSSHPEYHRQLLRVKVCKLLYSKKLAGFRESLADVEAKLQETTSQRNNLNFRSVACTVLGISTSFVTHGISPAVAGLYGAVLKTQIANCEATEHDLRSLIERLENLIRHTEKRISDLELLPQNFNVNTTGIIEGENDL